MKEELLIVVPEEPRLIAFLLEPTQSLVPLVDVAHDVLHDGYCIGLLYH